MTRDFDFEAREIEAGNSVSQILNSRHEKPFQWGEISSFSRMLSAGVRKILVDNTREHP